LLSSLKTVLATVLLVASPFAFGEVGGGAWTLERIIDQGLQSSPRLKASRERLRAATLRAERSGLNYYPSLDLTANHGVGYYLPEPVPESNPYRSQFGLTLSQNIYDNGKMSITADLGRLNRELASLTADQVKEQFILDVTNAFIELSVAQLYLDIGTAKLKIVERQHRLLKNQVQQGFRSPRDLMRLDAEAQKARVSNISSDAQIANLVNQLTVLCGISSGLKVTDFNLIKPGKNIPTLPETVDAAKSFESRLQKIQQELGNTEIDLVKRQYGPQVFVSAAAGYSANDYVGSGSPIYERDQFEVSAMIEFKYNLWDGGRERRDLGAALADQAAAEAVREESHAVLVSKIETLAIEKTKRLASFSTAKRLLELEEDSYQYLEKAYREGKTTYLDLVTGLDNLTQSQLGFARAYFDIVGLAAQYRYYEGASK
jgi:outer membrane protein TolC